MNPLKFSVEPQKCCSLCWASVGQAICAFYKLRESADQQEKEPDNQQDVVNLVLDLNWDGFDCESKANRSEDLEVVLTRIDHFEDGLIEPSFKDIQREIDRQRPVVVHVEIDEPAAPQHAIAMYGYTQDGAVYIADPLHAEDRKTACFKDLLNGPDPTYHYTWKVGYRTRPK